MNNEQQLGQIFGATVIGNVKPGHALDQSAEAANDFLGLGNDSLATGNHAPQKPVQLDGCALNAK